MAARNENLGGTLTTFAVGDEPAVRSLLNVPDQYALAAMLPMGKPVKQLTRLKRKAVEEIAVTEHFDGPVLSA